MFSSTAANLRITRTYISLCLCSQPQPLNINTTAALLNTVRLTHTIIIIKHPNCKFFKVCYYVWDQLFLRYNAYTITHCIHLWSNVNDDGKYTIHCVYCGHLNECRKLTVWLVLMKLLDRLMKLLIWSLNLNALEVQMLWSHFIWFLMLCLNLNNCKF